MAKKKLISLDFTEEELRTLLRAWNIFISAISRYCDERDPRLRNLVPTPKPVKKK